MINNAVEAMFDQALGWPFQVLLRDGGVATASIGVEFLTPSRHGDQLDCTPSALVGQFKVIV